MSLDLRDIRIKVTVRTHAMLEARARVTGEEISAIARDLLEQHVQREIDVVTVADRLMKREGFVGIIED